MPIEVELPDGSIAEFPDGMGDDEISSVIQRQFGSPQQETPSESPYKAANQQLSGWEQFKSGVETGLKRPALGIYQLGQELFGGTDTQEYKDMQELANTYRQKAEGTGAAGVAGEIIGDPTTYLPVGAPAKALNQLVKIGATQGFISGALNPTIEGENRGVEAVKSAATGAALAPVSYAAGKAMTPFLGGSKVAGKNPVLGADDLSQMASGLYKKADDAGGAIKPETFNKFIASLDDILPQTKAGMTVSGENEVTKLVQRMKTLSDGQPITLQAAQEIDEGLGDLIDNFFRDGRLAKEGVKISNIQNRLRDMIEAAGDSDIIGGKEGFKALKDARAIWSQSRKMRDIERIITRAEMMDNPATAIKTGFRTLYNNPSRIRGFSPTEKALIKKAANSGVVSDALRTAGSRLIPIIAGATGAGMGGTIAAQAASAASRGAASAVQVNKASKVAKEISDNALRKLGKFKEPQAAIYEGVAKQVSRALPQVSREMQSPVNNMPAQAPIEPADQPEAQPLPPEAMVKPPLMDRIAMAESGGNPNAVNPMSSASGLFQFTNDTWKRMVEKHGKRFGITVADKNKPEAQRKMAELLADENAKVIRAVAKREPTEGEIYAAHFFGAPDTAKMLRANESTPAARVTPKAAKANPSIFFDGKRPRTVAEVMGILESKVS